MTTLGEDPADAAAQSHERAIVARERGDYPAAEAAARDAVEVFAEALGTDSPDLANALVEWGRAQQSLDRLPEARAAFARACAILAPFLDDSSAPPEVADELFRLASVAHLEWSGNLRAAGGLDDAELACRAVLARLESRLSPDDPLISLALNSLGVIHKFQGRLDEAELVYRRALRIADRTQDPFEQATLLHNLGGVAHARGEHARGEPLARRSVELRTRILGADHPITAADRAAWAALLEGLGRMTEAEEANLQALAVFEPRLGPDSLEVASTLTALAGIWRHADRLEDAERAYRRAVEIRERRLGPDHFDLAMTLNNLGMLLGERGRFDEALSCVRRAAKALAAELGAAHPHAAIAAQNLRTLTTAARRGADPDATDDAT
jgi:tetratricopeptide (TPR) repeat protein